MIVDKFVHRLAPHAALRSTMSGTRSAPLCAPHFLWWQGYVLPSYPGYVRESQRNILSFHSSYILPLAPFSALDLCVKQCTQDKSSKKHNEIPSRDCLFNIHSEEHLSHDQQEA